MAVASVQPVSVAVHTVLNVAGFTALSTYDGPALKQRTTPVFPVSYYQIRGEDEDRGLGTGSLPRVEIWVHGLGSEKQTRGFADAHAITSKAKELLSDAALTVSGFTHAGKVFFDRIVDLEPYDVNGVRVFESVAQFYTWVEAT